MSPSAQRGRIVTQNELMIVTGQFWPSLQRVPRQHLPEAGGMCGAGCWSLPRSRHCPLDRHAWCRKARDGSPRPGSFGEALGGAPQDPGQGRGGAEFEEVKAMAGRTTIQDGDLQGPSRFPWIRRIFVVGIGMAVIHQITGVNAIMYYGTHPGGSGFGREAPCGKHRQRHHLRGGHLRGCPSIRRGAAGCSSPGRWAQHPRCCPLACSR